MGKTRSLVTAAFLAAVLVASKFALDGLPNIELVSLLVILYTLEYPRLAVPAVYTYVFVYGLLNGFGIWWFPQLYIWAVLMLFARLMRQNRSVLLWALLSGLFGLCYGALYAVSYAVMNGGIAAGVAWWVTGIPFDLLHGAGNFVVALLLYKPLRYCLQRASSLGRRHKLYYIKSRRSFQLRLLFVPSVSPSGRPVFFPGIPAAASPPHV